MKARFKTADEAIAWYNAWLRTATPPRDMEGCRECDEQYGGWDPVIKWHLQDGRPVYWYVVGTGGSESLVIEGEDTIRSWGNQYYHYFAANEGREAAEDLLRFASLPEKAPPMDLEPSTPESVYWAEQGIAAGETMRRRTMVRGPSFPTRTYEIGDITATVEHLGEGGFEPGEVTDWWKITVQGPKRGLKHQTELGGSRDEYENRETLRKEKGWGSGPLEHVLYELNWAANEPEAWYDFEVDGEDPGRKDWDPRRKITEARIKRAKAFLAVAKRFDGLIQPAFDLWHNNWKDIESRARES